MNVSPFILKLELLKLYMLYSIDFGKDMVLSHKFHTYPPIARDYFVEGFTKAGCQITEDRIIRRKKSFEEWQELFGTLKN